MRVLRAAEFLSEWSGKLISFFILGLAVIVGYEVVARYVFQRPTLWVHELSGMFFGTFIIVGGAYTLFHGGHVNMDVIYGRLSPRGKAWIDLLTFPIFLCFVGVLLWKGGGSALRSLEMMEHSSSQWGPPLYPFKLVLPVGMLLLLVQGLCKFVKDLLTVIGKHRLWTSD